ncbi:hypothetical protein KS4_08030 [Poriferisphaera corsica]|uniref:Uncharacterized protein n=1 Tax=Poriferisphaera corsica TaxID=2528020 RepID=A0A517YRB5_9BACT|nr:hypothetical protein KS4_08030 [Poriferisphaera corsica]
MAVGWVDLIAASGVQWIALEKCVLADRVREGIFCATGIAWPLMMRHGGLENT